MKPLIWIAILVVIAIAALWWRSHKGGSGGSFWDVVRNPGSLPNLGEMDKKIAATAEQLRNSPEDISRLVDYFVFEASSSREAWTERRILRELGDQAYPQALAILGDSSLRQRLQILSKADGDFSLPEAPINRLCEIFDGDAPPPQEAAALLVPFIIADAKEIKKSVGLMLGSIGRTDSIPHIQTLLNDSDAYVRSFALMGIERAVRAGRIAESGRQPFYDLVSAVWPKDTDFNVSDHVASLMLDLNREAAVQRLLSDEFFNPEFESLDDILEAFDKKKVSVPHDKLINLIQKLLGEPLEYPRDNMLRESLSLLGTHRKPENLPLLEKCLDHANEAVIEGAVRGLYHHHQFTETIRDAWEVEREKGWAALTLAERHILAIEMLSGEVDNGGFAQYYFNSTGDQWNDALAGLEVVGAVEHKELMVQTLNFFADQKPSADRDVRSEQLAKIARKKDDPFEEQDSAWYKIKDESLDKLMLRYNLANLEGRQK